MCIISSAIHPTSILDLPQLYWIYPLSSIFDPRSSILHPQSSILHPQSSILHPHPLFAFSFASNASLRSIPHR